MNNLPQVADACDNLFGKPVSADEYKNILVEDFGRGDMKKIKPNRLNDFVDAADMAESISKIHTALPGTGRSRKILVMGSAQGRLAEIYTSMGKKCGVREIIFNDFIEERLKLVRSKIKNLYGNDGHRAGQIQISYLGKDILDADLPAESVDAVFKMNNDGTELVNPEGDRQMEEYRMAVYRKINSILVNGGGLLEVMPDANIFGFYKELVKVTALALSERGLLPTQRERIFLTNDEEQWASSPIPYRVVYAPSHLDDYAEKEKAGFEYVTSKSRSKPDMSSFKSARIAAEIIQDMNQEEALRVLRSNVLNAVTRRIPMIPRRSGLFSSGGARGRG